MASEDDQSPQIRAMAKDKALHLTLLAGSVDSPAHDKIIQASGKSQFFAKLRPALAMTCGFAATCSPGLTRQTDDRA
jgi:hypothetical protein